MINVEALEICGEAIKNTRKAIITSHINPDGDAIGSALALYHCLKQLDKKADIIIDSPVPYFLKFLSGAAAIQQYNPSKHNRAISEADTIFFLDLNDIRRVRSMDQALMASNATKVLIDHHVEPQDFCQLCIVDTDSSSTGELVWRIIDKLDVNISKEIADGLYVAIMTDTGSFRFDKTTGELHRIIAKLIDAGANPSELYDKVYNQNPYNTTKLLGLAIASMELYYDGKLCIMTITDEMFRSTGTTDEEIEGFVEKTLMIKGVEVGILISEVVRRDEMRISFRSKGERNVRLLAARFGGGGHNNASGAKITGTVFADMKSMLIRTAEMLFK